MHPRAFPSCFDQTGMPHDAEVTGYLEILFVQSLCEHTYAGFTVSQKQSGEPQSGHIGQDLEQ